MAADAVDSKERGVSEDKRTEGKRYCWESKATADGQSDKELPVSKTQSEREGGVGWGGGAGAEQRSELLLTLTPGPPPEGAVF